MAYRFPGQRRADPRRTDPDRYRLIWPLPAVAAATGSRAGFRGGPRVREYLFGWARGTRLARGNHPGPGARPAYGLIYHHQFADSVPSRAPRDRGPFRTGR